VERMGFKSEVKDWWGDEESEDRERERVRR